MLWVKFDSRIKKKKREQFLRCLKWNLLKSKGTPKEAFGSSKVGFFGWRTAEQEELMGCVHELQLLL